MPEPTWDTAPHVGLSVTNRQEGSAPPTELRQQVEGHLIEVFRKALMVEHHHDWDMETCAEAAHVCARAWCDEFGRNA